MTPVAKDRLHGTLDALVLKSLAGGPRHGYAIARWLEDTTQNAIRVEEGSLYPALYRMEKRGWLGAEGGICGRGRKAKLYKRTTVGRRQLKTETAEWSDFARAVSMV